MANQSDEKEANSLVQIFNSQMNEYNKVLEQNILLKDDNKKMRDLIREQHTTIENLLKLATKTEQDNTGSGSTNELSPTFESLARINK